MTRKLTQKQMIEKVYADLHYIRYEMKVNGSQGLENIQRSHDTQIKSNATELAGVKTDVAAVSKDVANLKDRGEVLWRATESIRAKADYWKAWKNLSSASPTLRFMKKVLMHKLVIYFLVGFFVFSFFLALGLSVGDALARVAGFFSKIKQIGG
jgi:hypothetical protein